MRRTLFPDHQLHFIGAYWLSFGTQKQSTHKILPRSIGSRTWRTLASISSAAHLGDIATSGSWHGKTAQAFFSGVDDDSEEELFEISLRASDKHASPDSAVSWGVPVTNDKVTSKFTVCCVPGQAGWQW